MKKEIKLILADIDGTIVTDEHVLTERTKKALRQAHEQGIMFGIATGRGANDQAMKERLEKWDLGFDVDMTIGLNGGEVYNCHTGDFFTYEKLSSETIKEIILMMEPLDLNPFFYAGDTMICKRIDDPMLASIKRNNMPAKEVKDLGEFWSYGNIGKMMYRLTEDQTDMVWAHVNAHPSDTYAGFLTQFTMLEFQDKRVSKGTALTRYCAQYDLPIETVAAFGDMPNDNSMLMNAGLGVAMKNSHPDTLAIADDVTEFTNNEDGFAQYIETHVL